MSAISIMSTTTLSLVPITVYNTIHYTIHYSKEVVVVRRKKKFVCWRVCYVRVYIFFLFVVCCFVVFVDAFVYFFCGYTKILRIFFLYTHAHSLTSHILIGLLKVDMNIYGIFFHSSSLLKIVIEENHLISFS